MRGAFRDITAIVNLYMYACTHTSSLIILIRVKAHFIYILLFYIVHYITVITSVSLRFRPNRLHLYK